MADDKKLSGLGLLLDAIKSDINTPYTFDEDKPEFQLDYSDDEMFGLVFPFRAKSKSRGWRVAVSELRNHATRASLLTTLKNDVVKEAKEAGSSSELAQYLDGFKTKADPNQYLASMSIGGPYRKELISWAEKRIKSLLSIVCFDRVVKSYVEVKPGCYDRYDLLGLWWEGGAEGAQKDESLGDLFKSIVALSEAEGKNEGNELKNRIKSSKKSALRAIHDSFVSNGVDLMAISEAYEEPLFWLPESIFDAGFFGLFVEALERTFPEGGLADHQNYEAMKSELEYLKGKHNKATSPGDRMESTVSAFKTLLVSAMVGPGTTTSYSRSGYPTDNYVVECSPIPMSSGSPIEGSPSLQRIVLTRLNHGICSYYTKRDCAHSHSVPSTSREDGMENTLRIGSDESWCKKAGEFLWFADLAISRNHAEISWENGGWVIESNPKNGTLLIRGSCPPVPPKYFERGIDPIDRIEDGDFLVFNPPNMSIGKEEMDVLKEGFTVESNDDLADLDLLTMVKASLCNGSTYAYRFEVIPKLTKG